MPKAEAGRKARAMVAKQIAVGRWLRQRAENVSALLLLAMFLCFILQIAARYVFNRPLGWTDEVSVLCWIWCTLWGAAFVLRERDEVRFDIIYSGVSEQDTPGLHDHHRHRGHHAVRHRAARRDQLHHCS